MFGAVNALFSGLAFLGVIVAILMQREELRLQRTDLELQRTELALTREEITGQREQMEAQTRALNTQVFESTLFQLLRAHGEIVDGLVMRSGGSIKCSGRECFREWRTQLQTAARRGISAGEATPPRNVVEPFKNLVQVHAGHYFRNLYQIVRFVDERSEEAAFHMRLVRAQLSRFEIAVLFYNCVCDVGSKRFKPLVEKHALLHGLDPHDLFDLADRDLLQPEAYGEVG